MMVFYLFECRMLFTYTVFKASNLRGDIYVTFVSSTLINVIPILHAVHAVPVPFLISIFICILSIPAVDIITLNANMYRLRFRRMILCINKYMVDLCLRLSPYGALTQLQFYNIFCYDVCLSIKSEDVSNKMAGNKHMAFRL